MDFFKATEKLMTMDEEAWSCHANPWSVWSRFSCLPLLVFAIWSRVWLGWGALIPLALVIFWTWYNPRAFGPPSSTNNWASKGTFGERVFLNRKNIPIPTHHQHAAHVLAFLSLPGLIILIYGLSVLQIWATLCGTVMTILPKIWFVDRMVWLYEDMKEKHLPYSEWLR